MVEEVAGEYVQPAEETDEKEKGEGGMLGEPDGSEQRVLVVESRDEATIDSLAGGGSRGDVEVRSKEGAAPSVCDCSYP